jgi:hypothetical protein
MTMSGSTDGSAASVALPVHHEGAVAAEFPEGDPRRGPFTDEQVKESADLMRDSMRWHRNNGIDWLAVRLQHSRGIHPQELAHTFEIGDHQQARKERGLDAPGRRRPARPVAAGLAGGAHAHCAGRRGKPRVAEGLERMAAAHERAELSLEAEARRQTENQRKRNAR